MNITIEFFIFALVISHSSIKWKFWFFGLHLPKKCYSQPKTKKNRQHHWILHIPVSLSTKFHFKENLKFWDQICLKRVFPVKNGKSHHHHWFLHKQIRLGAEFQLKLTIFIFWAKFTQKRSINIEFCMFELVKVLNFSWNWRFWFFGPNLPKKGFPSKTEKVNTTIEFYIFEVIYSHDHMFWEFFMFLPNSLLPQSKRGLIICNKLVYTSCLTICRTT